MAKAKVTANPAAVNSLSYNIWLGKEPQANSSPEGQGRHTKAIHESHWDQEAESSQGTKCDQKGEDSGSQC